DLDSGLVETCSDYLVSHTSALKEAVRGGQRGLDVAARYAQMFDGLLGSLCCAARAAKLRSNGLGRVALVAVGGYGRRLVAPHSDVDVLFLADHPSDERVAGLAECVLYPLWDAGVQIGHAVRGVEETLDLSKSDIRTSTTLLDLRHVAGDRSLVHELVERSRSEIFEADLDAFLVALESDITSRHDRYGGTLFLREPELKLGRGGLRDLDVVGWIARARWGVNTLEDLVAQGHLTRPEWMDLVAAQEHLWTVRNHLHVLTRRRHERLTFEDQESVAALLGYRDGARLGVEQFMQAHYRRARTIARLVDRMPERARRSRRKPPTGTREIAPGVLLNDAQVTLQSEALATDPALALRLYSVVLSENVPPDPVARDAVAAQAARPEFCQALRERGEANQRFCELLTHAAPSPLRRGSVLEELHEVGLLTALIPEFEAITGRVSHDTYHAYTADVHALLTVDRLRAVVRGELASEFPVVSRCAAELPRPLPLYAAALLSQLGAGYPGDAAKHAASMARTVCERLGMSAVDVRYTQWLIARQQSLYHWALRRDISDPDTIAEIAREVQTVDRLRDLYLLTFCSVSTANPTAMTAWNARMLVELWMSVSDVIEGRRDTSDYVGSLREQVLHLGSDPEERRRIDVFLAELPERYLLANSAADIVFHERLAAVRSDPKREKGPLVHVRGASGEDSLEVVVLTDDRPGLLADLTAALALHRYDVVSAQLYTRKLRDRELVEAFDIFHVTPRDGVVESGVDVDSTRLSKTIEQLVSGDISAEALLNRRSQLPSWARIGPRIKTEIGVDNEASKTHTVVDVYTRDRPELLYTIAHTIHSHGLTIALAKVNTEGRRASDVFYVQSKNGGKLVPGQLAKLSQALRDTIGKLDG
ncbi:MAG: [protein-PII] uridylyltransferase, partial [Polyangiales bacterium]